MNLRPACLLLLALAACQSRTSPPAAASDADARGDEHWFPLTAGTTWTYAGTHQGLPRAERVRVEPATRTVLGVACAAVVQEITQDGSLVEITTEWYARDGAGDVWKFGEETRTRAGEEFELTESWLAGVDGARAWVAFPAAPAPGDRYAAGHPDQFEEFEIGSVTEQVTVPAGAFAGCVQLVENPDDPEDRDIILFAPKVGRVREQNAEGSLELVSVRRE